MVATDPCFDAAVRGAVESMLAHIAEEEGELLPRLGAALTPVSLLQLGLQFEAAKVSGGCNRAWWGVESERWCVPCCGLEAPCAPMPSVWPCKLLLGNWKQHYLR